MRLRPLASLFSLLLVSHSTLAAPAPRLRQIPVHTSFKYQLYLADVECWIIGPCHGIVAEQSSRKMAKSLAAVFHKTKHRLDIAAYGVRKQPWLTQEIDHLHHSDVRVRITVDQQAGQVGEWENIDNFTYDDAIDLVNILGEDRVRVDVNHDGGARTGSIMHHKFFVLDDEYTWFGSTNFSETETGAEYNANASILVQSKPIAAVFTEEFEQMFVSRDYSIYKKPRSDLQRFVYDDGTKVELYFAPQDKPIDQAVIPFINGAKKSLEIGIFYLTSPVVAEALIKAHQRGVVIKMINDATAAHNHYSQNNALRSSGIDVRVENWGGKMHMKTAVRDQTDSLIGSANWTKSGNNSNDENLAVIYNNPRLAKEISAYISNLYAKLKSSLKPGYRNPRAEGPDSINSCADGIDNDHQMQIDGEERSCR